MIRYVRTAAAPVAFVAALLLVAVALPASPVEATGTEFTAVIDEDQEPDCNIGHNATGTGTFKLDKGTGDLTFDIEFTPLSSDETGAHIHGPADPGVSAPIIRGLPAGSPKVGSVAPPLEPDEIADLQAGLYYVNIHSENCPSGEIRGQILPVSVGGESIGGLSALGGSDGGPAWWIALAAFAGLVVLGSAAGLSLLRARR